MNRHRKKFAFAGVVILLLAFVYLRGGNIPAEKNTEKTIEPVADVSTMAETPEAITDNREETTESEEAIPVVQPPEKETTPAEDVIKTCTITIKCDTILNNMKFLEEAKHPLVPSDGVIMPEKEVNFSEGESVFDVLLRETHNNGIHLEFTKSPVYDSAYIEGIHNLYEFDCGELSGWMYSVNGIFPGYGCSKYELENGDRIEWVYTCALGNDVKNGVYNNE